ncbi:MAG: arginine--tRNA ligase [Kiritimatiellae bacterium]|jgi:arginyl-tRNA synthetase|nr:arginine--tRNA ligase [Kiritimatiellia bacterium]HHU14985.1 arginine--tRNA ligase [Lentisphaerota bacterium]HON47692.1 arginine--tRNA ligase [Kiritimatiellia bacterium]
MHETVNRCEEILAEWLRQAFQAAFGEVQDWSGIRVQPATDARFGDFQCNDAMQAAKTLRRPPRAVAEAVLAALPLPPMLTRAEIAGPGFINLTVAPEWLAEQVAVLSAAPRFGIPDAGQGRTVVIDYSSPNVAKPMHIGHIRSTVIGNALDRLHRALGYRVIADNHLGDWGTQFGLLIQGYRTFLTEAEREALTIEALERVYVQSYNRSKEDPAWLESCKSELVKLQQGDAENRAIWERFIAISRREFDRVYGRLDVAFDLTRGESYYNDMLPETIQVLQDKGLAVESEGALVVNLEDEGMPVCIVRKSDGGFNYAATDIATVRSRVAEFDPDRIIYVTDERQQLHFRQFFAVCAKLGYTTHLEHVWFGLMRLPEGTFSTRQGNVIKLESLLDEAERRALEIIKASNSEMPEDEQRELAVAIGIGAIKYTDLSHDPQTMIVFTWEKALALEGNSGPYLQYAYARVCSLLDKYAEQVPDRDPLTNALLLDEPVEKALALQLMRFPATVLRAAEVCKPSVLADYLFSLSQTYSSFYQRSPVLKADAAVRDSRIRLCAMVAQVLAEGLGLLGICTPRRI